MDTLTAEQRTWVMSRIRSVNTKPELIVRKALHAAGFRFRLHARRLPGRPDLVLPKYRAAVFVNGCFWHKHPGCNYAATSKTWSEFWQEKLKANVERDVRNLGALRRAGWRTAVVWECGLRGDFTARTMADVVEWLVSQSRDIEVPSTPPRRG